MPELKLRRTLGLWDLILYGMGRGKAIPNSQR